MDYGRAIRLVRATRGLSQKRLAKLLDVDPSYVSLLERGERTPSASTLESIASEFNVPLYLLVLLGSDDDDLAGVTTEHAKLLGAEILRALIHAEEEICS